MDEATNLDRLRAWVAGQLAPDEAARFERELAADPALREWAEEYRTVHTLTGAAELEPPACTVSFESLERRIAHDERRSPFARRVAAAALLFVLAAAGALAWRAWHARAEPLVLESIAIDASAAPEPVEAQPLPELWAHYEPRGEDGVRWIDGLDEGARLANAARRPLLVYGFIQGCPMCKALDEHVFKDAGVLDLVDDFVPVRVDLARIPPAEAQAMVARSYPFLEVWNADRTSASTLANEPDPEPFRESLGAGLDRARRQGDAPTWESVRALATRFQAASASEARDQLGAAQAAYRSLAREAGSGLFDELAEQGLARIAARVRERFLEARETGRDDPERARKMLADLLASATGTTFERDLRATLERLEREGRFPPLATASE